MTSNNTIKTTLLLGGLTGMFVLIGSMLGGTGGMIIAFVFAVGLNMAAWYFSDSLALRMSGAQEVAPEADPNLHATVARLAAQAAMPKPRVFMIDTDMPNAFATGRSPERGVVAVTRGIMAMLTPRELEGVIAHELAHIKHRDTLISSIAATIGGAISILADMAFWGAIFGGGGDDEEGGGIVGGFLMMILAPIAALIIQMAISRSREFAADEGAARITGDPSALASALEKLEGWAHNAMSRGVQPQAVNPATSHLYITPPPMMSGLANLFRTHPQTAERVARLEALRDTLHQSVQ